CYRLLQNSKRFRFQDHLKKERAHGMESAFAAAQSTIKVGMKFGVWDLIWNSGTLVKFVLLILLAFSVLSWAIILAKNIQLARLDVTNGEFLELFWKAKSLDGIFNKVKEFEASALAQVFRAGYMELQKIAEKSDSPMELSGIENVSRALRKASDNEISR